MKILYGLINNNIDVTEICLNKLTNNNIITIPNGDENRAGFFSDPLFGIKKKIFILNDNNITEYGDFIQIKINIINNEIKTINQINILEKLYNIHSKLKINYGNFLEEFPEQILALRYLNGNEKVLEIGGNIGRNSLVIGHILKENNNSNFVTMESDPDIANQLRENRDLNRFDFYIENSALSKRKLIQYGWETFESDVLKDGHKAVKSITLDELYSKYNIIFDTMVIDCEGAFYYILIDFPEILNNINLIIMENDYYDISHKLYVDDILKKNNFYRDHVEGGGWGSCADYFFEVWKKGDL
jgi:FkbM family methyltransferase